MKKLVLSLSLCGFLFASEEKVDLINRIETHFLLEDSFSALKEAEKGLKLYPSSLEINCCYLKALSGCGSDCEAIKILNSLQGNLTALRSNTSLLEDISWSILKKGIDSTQYSTRLSSMIGIFFTRDARAVNVLNSMMSDSNAILRSVAVTLGVNYKDDIIKEKVASLLDFEKVWLVRLEVLKAIGQMKISEKAESLKNILKDNKATFQERAISINSLVEIYDSVELSELNLLVDSPYAGFRSLGCELGSRFKIKEVKDKVLNLVFDPRSDVRISALNAIVLFYKDEIDKQKLVKILEKAYKDTNPFVAITAAWAGLVLDKEKGTLYLKKWLFDKYAENRRFAAAAVAQSGIHGVELGMYALKNSDDPFVKANIALGLIGQRESIKQCCDTLYDFTLSKKQMWMWDSSQNSLFRILLPSEIRHLDQMPNYPEAIDQIVQLNILSMLAILEDPRAQDAIKTFLKRKTWGITGLAAITLLQEGDEESLNLLRELLKDKEKYVRIQSALALAIIGKDKSAFPVLEEAYFSADHELKLNILGAVAHIANKEALPFLLKVLEEPFQILRVAAASAIIQAVNL